jgi:hypothetical protein
MIIQALLSIFLLFALSRVVAQVKSAKLSVGAFLFWSALFIFALVGVLDPNLTTHMARRLGIGRGSDVVFYISIALLFYMLFRLSIAIEELRRDLGEVIRRIALKDSENHSRRRRKKKH